MTANSQDVGAALSSLMYILPDDKYRDNLPPNATVGELLEQIDAAYTKHNDPGLYRDHFKKELDQCRTIINANGLNDARFLDASWLHEDGSGKPAYGSMNAAVFEISGEIHVSYRGTGKNNWGYNADSAYGSGTSEMQRWAGAYLDDALDAHYEGGRIHLSGHSQGGNNAAYATLTSKYADLVSECISVDGPGFNRDFIDDYIRRNGQDRYDALRSKCFGVYGENDPVHCVGEVNIIPHDQRTVVATPTAHGFPDIHSIFSHYKEDGTLQDPTEPGPVSELFDELNEYLQTILDREDRHDCAQALMAILETLIGSKDVSELAPVLLDGDHHVLAKKGVPVILLTAIANLSDSWKTFKNFTGGKKESEPKSKDQTQMDLRKVAWVISCFVLGGIKAEFLDPVIDTLGNACEDAARLLQSAKRCLKKLQASYIKSTPGGKYASEHPDLRADPDLLREYAARLERVDTRLQELKSELSGAQSGMPIIGTYSGSFLETRIRDARLYLEYAAERLETAERRVVKCWGA